MSTIISILNQKGGAGKTTTSRSLGVSLSEVGKSVLLIDTDPQGNLTESFYDGDSRGLFNALSDYEYEIVKPRERLHLLTSSDKLSNLEKSLIGEIDYHIRLKNLISNEKFKQYDYILLDCPPNLGILTINALTASQYILIPVNSSLFSMQGTSTLLETIEKVRNNFNPELELLGVVLNAYDDRPTIFREIRKELKNFFRSKLFKTTISRSIKFEEAIADMKGVTELEGDFKVKSEVNDLTKELLIRLEGVKDGQEA